MGSRTPTALLGAVTILLGGATVAALSNLPGHRAAASDRPSRDAAAPGSAAPATTTATTSPSIPRRALAIDDAPAFGTALPAKMQRALDDDLAHLHEVADVAPYLAELQARARRQGVVTAVDVESGVAAIARFAPPDRAPAEIARYQQQMLQLGRALDGHGEPPRENLPALANLIARSGDDAERQALTRRYLEAVMREPADEQSAALQRLQPTTEGSLRP